MEINKTQNDYLVFGNVSFFKCRTTSINGYLSLELSGSLKQTELFKNENLPSLKENVNPKLKFNFVTDENVYNSFSFVFQDCLMLSTDLQQQQETIINKYRQSMENPQGEMNLIHSIGYNLCYTNMKINFINHMNNLMIQFVMQDKYDMTRVTNFYVTYNDYRYITMIINYYIQNYISINNMLINKYYNQSIANQLYDNIKMVKGLLTLTKENRLDLNVTLKGFTKVVSELSNIITNSVVDKISNDVIDNEIINKPVIKEEPKIKINESKIKIEEPNVSNVFIDPIESNFVTNNEINNVLNNNIDIPTQPEINSNNIQQHINESINQNTQENFNTSLNNVQEEDNFEYGNIEYEIPEDKISYVKMEDAYQPSEEMNINVVEYDKPEEEINEISEVERFEKTLDNFMETNENVIKNNLIEDKTDTSNIVNEEIKEKVEAFESMDLFDIKKYKSFNDIRVKLNTFTLMSDTDVPEIYNYIFSKFNKYVGNLYNEKIINENNLKILRTEYLFSNIYDKVGLYNGYYMDSIPSYPLELSDDIINDKEIVKFISFIFICMTHLHNLQKILVRKQVDPIDGIKDERKTTTMFKILFLPLLLGYFKNKQFNKEKFLENVWNMYQRLDKDFFESEIINKDLKSAGIMTFENFYSIQFFDEICTTLMKFSSFFNINSITYEELVMQLYPERYKFKPETIKRILEVGNNDIDKRNEFTDNNFNMNHVILKIVSTEDGENTLLMDLLKDNIDNGYMNLKNDKRFNRINWPELSLETLRSIVVYDPYKDPRIKIDYNYYLSKVKECDLNKPECISLLNGIDSNQEQKIEEPYFV